MKISTATVLVRHLSKPPLIYIISGSYAPLTLFRMKARLVFTITKIVAKRQDMNLLTD